MTLLKPLSNKFGVESAYDLITRSSSLIGQEITVVSKSIACTEGTIVETFLFETSLLFGLTKNGSETPQRDGMEMVASPIK